MPAPQPWSDAELATLREHYPTRGPLAMMALLPGRSQKGIQHKAYDIKIRMEPDAYIQHHRARAIRHSPERTARAYEMRLAGKGWKEIAATLGYASHDTAGASVMSYCMARGLAYPKTPPRPQKKVKPPKAEKPPRVAKPKVRQATMQESRRSPEQHSARPHFAAQSPEEWLARNQPRRAEMVTLDVVLAYLTKAGLAPRRNGKESDGARYYVKCCRGPVMPRSLVDIANRIRIDEDATANQWVVSGLYAAPLNKVGMGAFKRDWRQSIGRRKAA